MSNLYDKTRLLVAKREDEDLPMVIAAMPESTWEIIPVEDWDRWKREAGERAFDADWTAYDYIEVVMSFPVERLAEMFRAREIEPVSVTPADDGSEA